MLHVGGYFVVTKGKEANGSSYCANRRRVEGEEREEKRQRETKGGGGHW